MIEFFLELLLFIAAVPLFLAACILGDFLGWYVAEHIGEWL